MIFFLKKRICFIIILGLLCVNMEQIENVYAMDDMYSNAYAMIDGYNGRFLEGKNENEPLANASTTKILTCIITLENIDTDKKVTVSEKAAKQPPVKLGMKVTEEYRIIDLLHCLMLESYNDCAVAIAESVAGSTEEFANLMNEKAKEIGCENSYFITPNGLDAQNNGKNHHSSAKDLCKIMKYCCWDSTKSNEFKKITQQKKYIFKNPEGVSVECINHNEMLFNNENVVSGKTGFTSKAGYCYVMAYEKAGKRMCIALLGCGWPDNNNYKWADAGRLIEYCEKNYVLESVGEKTGSIELSNKVHGKEISFENWMEPYQMSFYYNNQTKINYLLKDGEKIERKEKFYKEIKFPICEDETIGVVEFYINNDKIHKKEIKSDSEVKKWNICDIIHLTLKEFY